MKLPLFGYSDKQVVNAQWNIITILTEGLTEGQPSPAQQLLLERLCSVPKMHTPGEYARTVAQAMAATVAKVLQQRDDLAAALKKCEQERHTLQSRVNYFEQHPPQEQLREQAKQIKHWRERAQNAEEDIAELKAALVREQRANQARQNRLEGEIAELNRLVVEQQETINVYRK